MHETFSGTLHCLFVEAYMPDLLNGLVDIVQDKIRIYVAQELSEDIAFSSVEQQYRQTKYQVLRGDYGKTPQFWAVYIETYTSFRYQHE